MHGPPVFSILGVRAGAPISGPGGHKLPLAAVARPVSRERRVIRLLLGSVESCHLYQNRAAGRQQGGGCRAGAAGDAGTGPRVRRLNTENTCGESILGAHALATFCAQSLELCACLSESHSMVLSQRRARGPGTMAG